MLTIEPPRPSDAHAVGCLACAHERTGEVDRPQTFESIDGVAVERAVAAGDAGVVDQHVETTEAVVDLGEHRQHRLLVADVGPDRERIVADLVGQRGGQPHRWRRS